MKQPVVAVALALCLASIPARADPPVTPPGLATRLEYTRGPGAETCPDEVGLRNYVAARMSGDDPFTPNAPNRLTVTITGREPEFFGRIALYDETGVRAGVRDFTGGPTCVSLVQDLALTIRLIVRPYALPPPAASTPPTPPAPPLPLPAAPSPPRPIARPAPLLPQARSTERPRPQVGAAALAAFGSAPAVALGFGGLVRLRWPKWSLGLEGRRDLVAPMDAEDHDGMPAASALAFATMPCVHLSGFIGCHVSTVGVVYGDATHRAVDDSVSTQVASGVRMGVEWQFVPHVAAELTGEVLVNFLRPAVRVDNDPKWTAELVTGAVGVRVVASFF